jgi:hypothetical protein
MTIGGKITVKLSEEAREKLEYIMQTYNEDMDSMVSDLIISEFDYKAGPYWFYKQGLKMKLSDFLHDCNFRSTEKNKRYFQDMQREAAEYMRGLDPKIVELMEKYPK